MALDRLRSAGLVGRDREEIANSRLRRYFRLTDGARRCWAPSPNGGGPAPPWLRSGGECGSPEASRERGRAGRATGAGGTCQ